MAGSALTLTGSRLQNATRVNQAVEDADVTDWAAGDDFIVCTMVEALGHGGADENIGLRWRNVTDSGSFTSLGAGGEFHYNATTDLLNGNAVTSGEAVCTPVDGTTYVDGTEIEGNVPGGNWVVGQDEYSERQWAVDTANALAGKQYEFELYSFTESTSLGTLLAQITMAASANIDISAGVDALVLDEKQATVNAETSIAAGVDALVVATFNAPVTLPLNIDASSTALVLAERQATVNAETNITAGTDALVVATFQANVALQINVDIAAGVDALVLAEQQASVNAETSIAANVDALTITTFQVTIAVGENIDISAGVDVLVLAEYAATVNAETNIQVSTQSMVITTLQATISVGVIESRKSSGMGAARNVRRRMHRRR